MEKTDKLEGGVTARQVEEWKRQYGDVFLVSVPIDDSGEKHVHGYFHKPNLESICLVSMYEETEKPKCVRIVIDNCFLGGDPEFKHNGEVQLSAYNQVLPTFRIRIATIKNL